MTFHMLKAAVVHLEGPLYLSSTGQSPVKVCPMGVLCLRQEPCRVFVGNRLKRGARIFHTSKQLVGNTCALKSQCVGCKHFFCSDVEVTPTTEILITGPINAKH